MLLSHTDMIIEQCQPEFCLVHWKKNLNWFPLRGALGCKNALNFTCLPMKFHNCVHTNSYLFSSLFNFRGKETCRRKHEKSTRNGSWKMLITIIKNIILLPKETLKIWWLMDHPMGVFENSKIFGRKSPKKVLKMSLK